MSDPRFVAPRCHARFNANDDLLRRFDYVCMFARGHKGMHWSNEVFEPGAGVARPLEGWAVMRWGTQEQFEEEHGAVVRVQR